ncbi:MAG: MlaE family ABC transporter permease [Planctomycetota bacterium]
MWVFFGNLGRSVIATLGGAGYSCLMLLQTLRMFHLALPRWRTVVQQMYITGVQSLLVSMMFAGFAGMILALQTGIEIRKYGLESRIGSIVALSMLREMGPLMTAIILTGRIGSSMAAEIGTMAVSEEIDALETMAIDPVKFIVLPRVMAMALVAPMVAIMSSTIGILGGAFVSWAQIGVNFETYLISARWAVEFRDIYWGIGKAVIFGIAISTIACANGIRTRGGALGVGQASRNAVVTTLVIVIVFNYMMSSFFLAFDPGVPKG